MTSYQQSAAKTAAETRQIVLKDIGAKYIGAKWSKLSELDLSAPKRKDDLVTQVGAKYGLERGQAQRDIDAMLKGRQI
jgi:hypothetical protein